MRSKLRPTVILLAMMLTGIVIVLFVGMFIFLDRFTPESAFWKGFEFGALAAAVLIVIGSAVTAISNSMIQVSQDAPPPTVPAGTHEHLMDKALGEHNFQGTGLGQE